MTSVKLYEGDSRQILIEMFERGEFVDSVVTDAPYHLDSIVKRFGKEGYKAAKFGTDGALERASKNFIGQTWDGTDENGVKIAQDPEFWRLVFNVLKPGGYIVSFASSRTYGPMQVAMEEAGFITHPLIGWVNGCLDLETDCLTKRGWLNYTEILPTDEVAQWDSVTGDISWVIPLAIHEYDFDGHMVTLENRHTCQVLTPNHRVYAKIRRHSRHPKAEEYEVICADDLGKRPSNWSVDLPMAGTLIGGENIDPDYAYIVGWWLTDAWVHKDANACMFSQAKPKTLEKLRDALAPHGASEYVKERHNPNHQNEHSFYLTGDLADRLRREFPDREITWGVMSWNIEARKALYEGMMDGDGSRGKVGQYAEAFWSLRQTRRDIFMALSLSIGNRAYECSENGVVYVNSARSSTQVSGKHRSQRVPYNGKVWCLTVPTGAFVARRKGRPFITGNSGMPKAHSAAYHLNRQNENELAAKWEGWSFGGQARKPAMEPIYVGQKPFSEKTCAKNIIKHGVGAVNIDACRTEDGKWPANIILDGSEEVAALFPDKADKFFENYPFEGVPIIYHRKANKEDRAGSAHATVKPIGLMRSLVRHVTPVGGTTLDPFAGSGTTGQAALEEGLSCILIEREEAYCCDIKRRLGVNSDDVGTESLYLRILGIN